MAEINFDITLQSMAEALKTTIDALSQSRNRLQSSLAETKAETFQVEEHLHAEEDKMKAIQKQHQELIRQSKDTNIDTSLIDGFIKTITQAGEVISDPEYRSQLRVYTLYWSNFLKERDGKLPRTELEPPLGGAKFASSEHQIALIRQEKAQLELEAQRLELLATQLEIEKKRIEYALEVANKVVDTLYPKIDEQARAIVLQSLLSNLLQLSNSKGLALVEPIPKSNEEKRPDHTS